MTFRFGYLYEGTHFEATIIAESKELAKEKFAIEYSKSVEIEYIYKER